MHGVNTHHVGEMSQVILKNWIREKQREKRKMVRKKILSRYYSPHLPVIPFKRVEKRLNKEDRVVVRLRSKPDDKESDTYDLTVPYFKEGPPEEWLLFLLKFEEVLKGQAITETHSKAAMLGRLLKGDALAIFNTAWNAAPMKTDDVFENALRSVSIHVFPWRALSLQEKYMHHTITKPSDTKARNYMAWLTEMNEYFP